MSRAMISPHCQGRLCVCGQSAVYVVRSLVFMPLVVWDMCAECFEKFAGCSSVRPGEPGSEYEVQLVAGSI